jgi:uncharacterized phage protein (TIGR02220 family)
VQRGYLRIWRKVADSGLLQMPNTFTLMFFLTLQASHKQIKVGTKYGVILLERGQGICAVRKLADELKQTVQEIRTSMDRLKKMEILTLKSTRNYSIYTIVNYDKYQNSPDVPTHKTTHEQHTSNTPPTQEQELKNLRSNTNTLSGKPDDLVTGIQKIKLNGKECDAVLSYLNEKVGSKFKLVESHTKLIQARFNEGATVEEMKQVIDQKTSEWKSNPEMNKYLRPATLFNAGKYSSYAGQLGESANGNSELGNYV